MDCIPSSSSTASTVSLLTDADISSEGSDDESEQTIALAEWDNWFADEDYDDDDSNKHMYKYNAVNFIVEVDSVLMHVCM